MIITRRCDFCNTEFEDNDDINHIVKYGIKRCQDCIEIYKLQDFLDEYRRIHHRKELQHEVCKKNFVKATEQKIANATSYHSPHLKITYEVVDRNNDVNNIIKKIDFVRKLLVVDIGAQFEILDSIYEKKDIFWEELGNLLMYVHNASYSYIVIKLKELLSGYKSDYSIQKIKQSFKDNYELYTKKQKVYEVFTYENGASFKIKYEKFPIDEFINIVDGLFEHYKSTIGTIDDFRDKFFAHIDSEGIPESAKDLSYVNIKRIYNMIKLIFDGFLLSIAPDELSGLMVDNNFSFSHLNDIVKEYRNNNKQI